MLEGVRRELGEETGIEVRVGELIEVFERINLDGGGKTKYHFVVLDYLCEAVRGEARAGSDVTDVAWAAPSELEKYSLTETATRVILKAFEMARDATTRRGCLAGGSGFGQASEAPLAAEKILDGGLEIGRVEFGPHSRREQQLGVGAFPQHEIAQPPLAARANQKIHVRSGSRLRG